MEPEPTVLDSLRKAVAAMPDDVPLRLHLATMLLGAGQRDEAVRQLGAVLQRDPGNTQALGLLRDPGAGPAARSTASLAGEADATTISVTPPDPTGRTDAQPAQDQRRAAHRTSARRTASL